MMRRLDEAGVIGFTFSEVEFIHDTMSEQRTDWLAEWGTNVGNSARVFYEVALDLDRPCEIHSIDICDQVPILRPCDEGRARGYHVRGLPVTLHVGDGITVAADLYTQALRRRRPPKQPLFFLDDSHEETDVLRQLEAINEWAPEAVILAHDTHTVKDATIGMVYHGPGNAASVCAHRHGYRVTELPVGQSMMRLAPA